MKFYYQWRNNFSVKTFTRGQKQYAHYKTPEKNMSTEKITLVSGKCYYQWRLTAINDELALTLTTEPVYKNIFLPGEGAQLPPSPRPFPASHHLTARPITGTNPYY